jgi:group I intron endonuclease
MEMKQGYGYKICGIYKITNSVNNKIYIGSSTNIYYRLRRHKSDLLNQQHKNPYLQNAYNKYGKTCFKVDIIETCSIDQIFVREQYYIDNLNPDYNIRRDVIANKISDETRKKISATMKEKSKAGIIVNHLNTDKKKEVDIYDCNCKHIKKFNGYNEAGRYLKSIYPVFKPNSTSQIIKSKSGKYKDYYLIPPDKECNNTLTRSDAFTIQIINIITDEIIVFDSAMKVAEYLNCSESGVLIAIKKSRLLLKKYKLIKL